MSGALTGRRVVVTGAAAGIGRATAARLYREGASVLLVDRAEAQLKDAVAEIETTGTGTLGGVTVDLTLDEAPDVVVQAALAQLGGLDTLVNVAGVPGPTAPILDCADAEIRAVLEVNFVAPLRLIRRAVPAMPQAGGVVVNIASTVGIRAAPLVSLYGASKQALISLSKSAAVELASRRIRVNAVCPGTVETSMTDQIHRSLSPDAPEVVRSRFTRAVPLRRYGSAEEIAGLVRYLVSDEAAYVTGAVYLIDGGATVA
jgi:NAD(P)-dependent dehydrogenase (short-subunit alcohol dehydrogenase family)